MKLLCCNDNLLSDNYLKTEYEKEFRDIIYFEKRKDLLFRLTELLDKELVQSFAEQLEQRLIRLLNESNQSFYKLLMEDNIGSDGNEIIGFSVIEFNILYCNDEKVDDKITYDIELNVFIKYANQDDKETFICGKKLEFIILYDFVQDSFFIKEYDNLELGRCNLHILYDLEE